MSHLKRDPPINRPRPCEQFKGSRIDQLHYGNFLLLADCTKEIGVLRQELS